MKHPAIYDVMYHACALSRLSQIYTYKYHGPAGLSGGCVEGWDRRGESSYDNLCGLAQTMGVDRYSFESLVLAKSRVLHCLSTGNFHVPVLHWTI